VSTLGTFQVWRGAQPIPASSWRREKARQLFQVFLANRDGLLDRDQLTEYLWPGIDPITAQRNFKIALNTLYQVLEPERLPGSESAYIIREGSAYTLRPDADIWLDADSFIALIRQAESLGDKQAETAIQALEKAIALYQGEFLPDARYENWATSERERLGALFLQGADRLSEVLLNRKCYEDTIQLCQRILSQDNCWERAYRHLMLAYDGMGDHGQIGRVYQRCVQVLAQELEVPPSAETHELFLQLTQRA
jgi:LuxR family maltose regulon positive regulatory protein